MNILLTDWRTQGEFFANLYAELGATDVKHNVNIAGNQIDVFAAVPSYDGSHTRTIISCKCYAKVVGVGAVREWNLVFQTLKATGKAEAAVIVSPKGFTQDAHALAETCGIRLTPLDRLRGASCDFMPYLRGVCEDIKEQPVFKKARYIPLRVTEDSTGKTFDAIGV